MLNMGVFLDSLTISKVIPIYKKEDDTMFSNYNLQAYITVALQFISTIS